MADIEPIDVFASAGERNTDGLTLANGFPAAQKPARQWFNTLFYDITSKINALVTAVNAIVNAPKAEPIKVGDIYITTINHANAAAVAAHHTYGTWERYAEARALVGAGTTVDARGETITVAAGQQFGSSQIIQQANQVGDHSHILGASSTTSNDGGTTYLDLIKVGTDEGYSLQGTETIPDTYQVKSSGTAEPMNICQPSLGTYFWVRLT
jgi:hypothetical protein